MKPTALGIQIKQYRLQHGMTQADFGQKAGLGKKYPHIAVSDLETGLTQNPTPRTIQKIRAVLDHRNEAEPQKDLEFYRGEIAALFKVSPDRVKITIEM
jgi:transcriptional regulator with XRE-family HTH domain